MSASEGLAEPNASDTNPALMLAISDQSPKFSFCHGDDGRANIKPYVQVSLAVCLTDSY
jgi:hypothetical protein